MHAGIRSRRRMIGHLLFLWALGGLTGGCLAVTFWAGHALTAAAPTPAAVPPSDLAVDALTIASASGARLSAWFVRGEPGAGAVLLLHAIRSNKQSMLGRARFLKALGFSVLMLDLQAHGESSGERITFGEREARDVEAAVLRLMRLAPGERIGVLGRSLGAAAAAFSQTKALYAAVVLEALYPSIDEAVANRLRLHLGAIGPSLAPLLLAQLEPWLGVDAKTLRPIERVGEFVSPVLVVHGSEDRHTTLAEVRRLYGAVRAPKAMYVVEGARHEDLHAYERSTYEARVGAFFLSHLRALPAASTQVSRLECVGRRPRAESAAATPRTPT